MKNSTKMRLATISPKIAREYLKKNVSNRALSQKYVEYWAKAMKDGSWILNGDSIKFDTEGNLIDGQHRLNAVILNGETVQMYVITGVDPHAFWTLGDQKPRSNGDTLSAMHVPNSSTVAAALRILISIENGGGPYPPGKIAGGEIVRAHEQHPGLGESVTFARKHNGAKVLPVGLVSYLHYEGSKRHPRKTAEWVELVNSGEFLEATSPIYALREKLSRAKNGREFNRTAKAALAIKSLKAFFKNKELTPRSLRWAENEEFPKL